MTRIRPAERRKSATFELVYQFKPYAVTISRFDSDVSDPGAGGGPVAEVFVSGPKSGEHMHAIVRDAAILASFALQLGAPVDVLRASVSRDERGQPHSIIGAVLDALAIEEANHHGS